MALASLTPGVTPNWTATATPAQQGMAGDIGFAETIIARWHTPCFETYATDKVIGVLALHASGIANADEGVAKIAFIANDGTPVDVTEPTQHPTLLNAAGEGYWGWWINLACAAADGIVEVRALVYPHSGLCRVLQGGYVTTVATSSRVLPTSEQSLLLWSNASGTYNGTTKYVATTGSDAGAGTIGDPFLTIDAAISSFGGAGANHSRILFAAGTWIFPRTATTAALNTGGWLTFAPKPGVTRAQVILTGGDTDGSSGSPFRMAKFQDITLDQSAGVSGNGMFRGGSLAIQMHFAYEGCKVIGPASTLLATSDLLVENSSGSSTSHVISTPTNRAAWEGWKGGPRGRLVYGVDVDGISADCFTGNDLTRDCTVRNHAPTPGDHCDLWQGFSGDPNRIMGDILSLDNDSQQWFFDSGNTDNTNVAMFNVVAKLLTGSGLKSQIWAADNMLIWHCTNDQTVSLRASATADNGIEECGLLSFHGNIIPLLQYDAGTTGVAFATVEARDGWQWTDNHFESATLTSGTGVETGDAGYDGDLIPSTNVGTTARTVRWDINQNPRAAITKRGAYADASEYAADTPSTTDDSVYRRITTTETTYTRLTVDETYYRRVDGQEQQFQRQPVDETTYRRVDGSEQTFRRVE